MRKLVLTAVLASVMALPAMAQQPMPWTPEIGLRMAYTSTDIDGTKITGIGLPGGSNYLGLGGVSSVYGTIPVSGRFAIEPAIGLTDISFSGNSITTANASARLLFSAWRGLYVGAGPTMGLLKFSGNQYTIWGAQVAAGYRFHLTGNLVGRGEVFYETQSNDDILGDNNASTFGAVLGLGLTPNAPSGAKAGATDALWHWAFGIQSGYTHSSGDDIGEVTSFAFPGSQGTLTTTLGFLPLPGVAPFFVQIPLGKRVALEPSFSYGSIDLDGTSKGSTYAAGLRANYAFNKTLYAGLSADYQGYGGDIDADASTGFGAAFGARFPIVSGFSGRTEVTWRSFSGDQGFIGDYTVTGLSFAILAPLK